MNETELPDSFIYTLFLCMDANFRQKNRYRATTYEDISLSDGWAYFVKSSPYMEYVSTFASQEEVSPYIVKYSDCCLSSVHSRLVPVPASKPYI